LDDRLGQLREHAPLVLPQVPFDVRAHDAEECGVEGPAGPVHLEAGRWGKSGHRANSATPPPARQAWNYPTLPNGSELIASCAVPRGDLTAGTEPQAQADP